MRFGADGAERHGSAGETLDDFAGRLDFVDGDRPRNGFELHQTAQRAEFLVLLVYQLRIFLERRVAFLAHGMLQLADGERIEKMALTTDAELIRAADGEFGLGIRER